MVRLYDESAPNLERFGVRVYIAAYFVQLVIGITCGVATHVRFLFLSVDACLRTCTCHDPDTAVVCIFPVHVVLVPMVTCGKKKSHEALELVGFRIKSVSIQMLSKVMLQSINVFREVVIKTFLEKLSFGFVYTVDTNLYSMVYTVHSISSDHSCFSLFAGCNLYFGFCFPQDFWLVSLLEISLMVQSFTNCLSS